MAIDVLRGGVDDDVCAVLEGFAEERRGKGVVHDEGNIELAGEFGELVEVENAQRRVADGLAKEEPRVRSEGLAQFFDRQLGIDQRGLNAEFFQCHGEQDPRTSVHVVGCDDVFARMNEVGDREQNGGLAGGGGDGADTAF